MPIIHLPAHISKNSKMNSLSITMEFCTVFISGKGTHFIANVMLQSLKAVEITDLTIYSITQKQVVYLEGVMSY